MLLSFTRKINELNMLGFFKCFISTQNLLKTDNSKPDVSLSNINMYANRNVILELKNKKFKTFSSDAGISHVMGPLRGIKVVSGKD